jgi:hypothetical protein
MSGTVLKNCTAEAEAEAEAAAANSSTQRNGDGSKNTVTGSISIAAAGAALALLPRFLLLHMVKHVTLDIGRRKKFHLNTSALGCSWRLEIVTSPQLYLPLFRVHVATQWL